MNKPVLATLIDKADRLPYEHNVSLKSYGNQILYDVIDTVRSADIKARVFTTHDRGTADFIIEQVIKTILERYEIGERRALPNISM